METEGPPTNQGGNERAEGRAISLQRSIDALAQSDEELSVGGSQGELGTEEEYEEVEEEVTATSSSDSVGGYIEGIEADERGDNEDNKNEYVLENLRQTQEPMVDDKHLYQYLFEADKEGADYPWRKDPSSVSDYFNYGFDEATWRMFCVRQICARDDLAYLRGSIGGVLEVYDKMENEDGKSAGATDASRGDREGTHHGGRHRHRHRGGEVKGIGGGSSGSSGSSSGGSDRGRSSRHSRQRREARV